MRPRVQRAFALLAMLAVLGVALPALVNGTVTPRPVVAARSPNIVLIVLDDLDARSIERMPTVREVLRDRGTSFERFFVAMPACCPSRASILRGQFPHNHGVVRNFAPDGGFPAFHARGHERSTVATWLDGGGYRTGLFGKYLNEYPKGVSDRYVPPGWDRWHGWLPGGRYFDYSYNENGQVVDYGSEPGDYETDVLSRAAKDFVEQAADARAPFFAYIAPPAPHEDAIPAPRHEGQFANLKAPRPPSFNEREIGDKPDWLRRESPRLSHKQIVQIDALYRDRVRSLLAVDEMVAGLFQTLRATRTFDNTYVFFTSDNGFLLGEHRQLLKGAPYEESIRVPLFVWGPGVPRRAENRLASNVDLAPTFAELAGVEPPTFVDGRSLVPLLDGDQASPWRQGLLVESIGKDPPNAVQTEEVGGDEVGVDEVGNDEAEVAYDGAVDWKPPHMPTFRLLRTPDLVYVEYYRGEDQEVVDRELYDLRRDPHQLENLAGERDRAGEVEELHRWLEALRSCGVEPGKQSCRDAEDAPPPILG